ncbi:MAG: hypothetical protein EOO88_53070, partial [Pedobacter sp.]
MKIEKRIGDQLETVKQFQAIESVSHARYHAASSTIVGAAGSEILFWKEELSPLKTLSTHAGNIEQLQLRGDRLFALSSNGNITMVNMKTREIMITIHLMQNEKEFRFAMTTPQGYYRIDPDLVNYFHFVKNGTVYPLSSFELQGNRPDKVFAALENPDTILLNKLTQVWRARVIKAGFDPDQLSVVNNRPVVDWNQATLPIQTTDSILTIRATFNDKQHALKAVLLRVNGVPEKSSKGIIVENKMNTAFNYQLALSSGQNNISLIAINEAGEESIEQTHTIYYQPTVARTSRTFYIGIGVSNYAEKDKNLRYAAK